MTKLGFEPEGLVNLEAISALRHGACVVRPVLGKPQRYTVIVLFE